jgi:hypothetical protein
MKARFNELCGRLRSLGFNGEAAISGGLVMITAFDKFSAAMIRRGFRKAKSTADGHLVECRFGIQSVFVWIDKNALRVTPDIRRAARSLIEKAA